MDNPDPYDLQRFVKAQQAQIDDALEELTNGRKASHWIWYIFPQYKGLGRSSYSVFYAIKSLEEAQAYLAHPVLAGRLVSCCRALLNLEGRNALQVMGSPDDMKLRSSMTLFAYVSQPDSIFHQVLDKYFGGERDENTLRLLQEV